MISISLSIGFFHPAIVSAIESLGADSSKVLASVNELIAANMGHEDVEVTGVIKSKLGTKKSGKVNITASGKLSGFTFDKDSPAGLLARCHWYLQGAADLYLKVREVELPLSVRNWVKQDAFKAVSAPVIPA